MDFTQFDRLRTLTPSDAAPQDAVATSIDGATCSVSVTAFASGIFRLRVNSRAKPDYGLIVASPDGSLDTRTVCGPSKLQVSAGRSELTLSSSATQSVALTLSYRGKPLLASITDEHFRGMAKPAEASRIAAHVLAALREIDFRAGRDGDKTKRRREDTRAGHACRRAMMRASVPASGLSRQVLSETP